MTEYSKKVFEQKRCDGSGRVITHAKDDRLVCSHSIHLFSQVQIQKYAESVCNWIHVLPRSGLADRRMEFNEIDVIHFDDYANNPTGNIHQQCLCVAQEPKVQNTDFKRRFLKINGFLHNIFVNCHSLKDLFYGKIIGFHDKRLTRMIGSVVIYNDLRCQLDDHLACNQQLIEYKNKFIK